MQILVPYLPYIQMVLALLLVAGVLIQQSGAGLGGAFGDNFSSAFHTRRGPEKVVFNATIVIAVLFALTVFLGTLLK
jgi:preprotein translocase subunit SecG